MIFLKKIARLIFYLFKGQYTYAFTQFNLTKITYYCFHHFLYSKVSKKSKKVVVFDLEHGDLGRYAYNLTAIFSQNDYSIYLKPRKTFYKSISGTYIETIFLNLNIGFLIFEKQILKYNHKILCTDRINVEGTSNYSKVLKLSYDGLSTNNEDLLIPFGFHPLIYLVHDLKSSDKINSILKKYRNSKRENRIYFGGRTFDDIYNQVNIKFPHIINRNFFFRKVYDLIDKQNLKDVLIQSSAHGDVIDNKNWLFKLSHSCFFLCPPGFEMPMCHNIIEAMACGSIPILQYNNLFTPQLVNNINCLLFTSIEELERQIFNAISMEKKEILRMKKNVINYYDNHLSSFAFIKNIEENTLHTIQANMIAGHKSLDNL